MLFPIPSAFRRAARFTPLLLLAALVAGCSTCQFNQQWRRAALGPVPTKEIEGRWEGRWLSDKNGHTGRLRCVVTHNHGKNYRFQFASTFWKVCRYTQAVSFQVDSQDGMHKFAGDEQLGDLAGGVYFYRGTIQGNSFSATYTNRYDHGTFTMRRVD